LEVEITPAEIVAAILAVLFLISRLFLSHKSLLRCTFPGDIMTRPTCPRCKQKMVSAYIQQRKSGNLKEK
jgi:hypothetical protein